MSDIRISGTPTTSHVDARVEMLRAPYRLFTHEPCGNARRVPHMTPAR